MRTSWRGAVSLTVAAACVTLTACGGSGSESGTPTTQRATTSVSVQADSSTTSPAATASPAVTVGEVPGNPKAAAALSPWVRDLVSGDLDQLVRKCWTIEPGNARAMYADKPGILDAVAQPGLDGQFAVIWKGSTRSVSVKRSEIASGYACPRVTAIDTPAGFNAADARYAVYRYLSRWVGKPVDADDVEGKYPLVCAGSTLSNNPGKLTGTVGFGDITVSSANPDKVEASVPVTNSSGVTTPTTFTLDIGSEGYCISDIRP